MRAKITNQIEIERELSDIYPAQRKMVVGWIVQKVCYRFSLSQYCELLANYAPEIKDTIKRRGLKPRISSVPVAGLAKVTDSFFFLEFEYELRQSQEEMAVFYLLFFDFDFGVGRTKCI